MTQKLEQKKIYIYTFEIFQKYNEILEYRCQILSRYHRMYKALNIEIAHKLVYRPVNWNKNGPKKLRFEAFTNLDIPNISREIIPGVVQMVEMSA